MAKKQKELTPTQKLKREKRGIVTLLSFVGAASLATTITLPIVYSIKLAPKVEVINIAEVSEDTQAAVKITNQTMDSGKLVIDLQAQEANKKIGSVQTVEMGNEVLTEETDYKFDKVNQKLTISKDVLDRRGANDKIIVKQVEAVFSHNDFRIDGDAKIKSKSYNSDGDCIIVLQSKVASKKVDVVSQITVGDYTATAGSGDFVWDKKTQTLTINSGVLEGNDGQVSITVLLEEGEETLIKVSCKYSGEKTTSSGITPDNLTVTGHFSAGTQISTRKLIIKDEFNLIETTDGSQVDITDAVKSEEYKFGTEGTHTYEIHITFTTYAKTPKISIVVSDTPAEDVTITFNVDPQYGSVDKSEVTVKNGTIFSEISSQVTVTEAENYKFNYWANEDGNEIKPYTKITSNTDVTGIFVNTKEQFNYIPIYDDEGTKIESYAVEWNNKYVPESKDPIDITIPSEYDGLPVTKISDVNMQTVSGGFVFNQNIGTVTIPASITEIGLGAFALCPSLTKVTFEENSSLEIINDSAFVGCGKLGEINLPSNLKYIGSNCFDNCPDNLFSVDATSKIRYLKQDANGTNDHFAVYDSGKATGTTIDNWKIDEEAKFVCSLEIPNDSWTTGGVAVTIPKNITCLSSTCFYGDSLVNKIDFASGSKIELIGSKAFHGTKITGITIPNNITFIGNPFTNLVKNFNLVLPDSTKYQIVDHSDYKLIVEKLVGEQNKLIGYLKNSDEAVGFTLPDNVSEIGDFCFCWSNISSFVVSENNILNKIGRESLSYCYNLTSIDFSNMKIDTIPYKCFGECPKLASINFGSNDSIKVFEWGAFYHIGTEASALEITIPNTINVIGADLFNKSNISKITFQTPASGTPSDWYAEQNSILYEIGSKHFTAAELSDPTQNASILTNTYTHYSFTRI